MFRRILLGFWVVSPLLLILFHFGPGQKLAERDRATDLAASAKPLVERKEWKEAIQVYDRALAMLPEREVADRREIQFSRGKALLSAGRSGESIAVLERLEGELVHANPESAVVAAVRKELAAALFCRAFLLRRSGDMRTWPALAKRARASFEALSAKARLAGKADDEAALTRSAIEVVRLETVSTEVLAGLTLPKECAGCTALE